MNRSWMKTALMVLMAFFALGLGAAVAQVDVNSASEAELRAIPGIGSTYARAIIENRPYTNKSQLKTRAGIPSHVYEQIKNSVVARQGSASGGYDTEGGSYDTEGGNYDTQGGNYDTEGGSYDTEGGSYDTQPGGGLPDYDTEDGTLDDDGYGTEPGNGDGYGTEPGTPQVDPREEYRRHFRNGRDYEARGMYAEAIRELESARDMAETYGSRDEREEILARLANGYLWRGVEVYNEASGRADYEAAIRNLDLAEFTILSQTLNARSFDDWKRNLIAQGNLAGLQRMLASAQTLAIGGSSLTNLWGGAISAARKFNLIHYYLGMSYFELQGWYSVGSYSWGGRMVDNKELAKVYLSLIVDTWSQFKPIFENQSLALMFMDARSVQNIVSEQLVILADARFHLAALQSESRDREEVARSFENYKEAHRLYKAIQSNPMASATYFFGEFSRTQTARQIVWGSARRRKTMSLEQKIAAVESNVAGLAKRYVDSNMHAEGRQVADWVLKNAGDATAKSDASLHLAAAIEGTGDHRQAIQARLQLRQTYAFDTHTLAIARSYRDHLNDPDKAVSTFNEVLEKSQATASRRDASSGIKDILLPRIDKKLEAKDFTGAFRAITAVLDGYELVDADRLSFSRKAVSVVSGLAAAGKHDEALKVIETMTGKYASANDALFAAKKIDVLKAKLDATGDAAVRAELAKAVWAFDEAYGARQTDVANTALKTLLAELKKDGEANAAEITKIYNILASRGDETGLQHHAELATAELARIRALPTKAERRAALLRMAAAPSADFAKASSVLRAAKEEYLNKDYASPWYYGVKNMASQFPKVKDDSGLFSSEDPEHGARRIQGDVWAELRAAIVDREERLEYAGWDAAVLDAHFGEGSETHRAWIALKEAVGKEGELFLTWKTTKGKFFSFGSSDPKVRAERAYEAHVKVREQKQADFLRKAWVRPRGVPSAPVATDGGDEGEISFDGLN